MRASGERAFWGPLEHNAGLEGLRSQGNDGLDARSLQKTSIGRNIGKILGLVDFNASVEWFVR